MIRCGCGYRNLRILDWLFGSSSMMDTLLKKCMIQLIVCVLLSIQYWILNNSSRHCKLQNKESNLFILHIFQDMDQKYNLCLYQTVWYVQYVLVLGEYVGDAVLLNMSGLDTYLSLLFIDYNMILPGAYDQFLALYGDGIFPKVATIFTRYGMTN